MSQLGLFFRIFFLTRNMLTWLHGQIPVRWQPFPHLTKKQEYDIEFESILPGRKQHIHSASNYSKFSRGNHERTVGATDSVDCKVIWMDYVRNSEEPAHKNYEYANTWFFARKSSLQVATWSKIRRCAGRPKDTPDNVVASCVLYRIRMHRCIRARL